MTTLKTLAGACALALLAIAPAPAQTPPPPYGPPIGIENARKVMAAAEAEATRAALIGSQGDDANDDAARMGSRSPSDHCCCAMI